MRRSSVSRLVGRSVPIKAFEGHLDQSRHASNEAANVAHAHNYQTRQLCPLLTSLSTRLTYPVCRKKTSFMGFSDIFSSKHFGLSKDLEKIFAYIIHPSSFALMPSFYISRAAINIKMEAYLMYDFSIKVRLFLSILSDS